MPLETTYDTQVAIIGAGPTGLSLACQLDRYGIDFILLDKSDGVTPYSKAIGVQARTLEIYDQMELAQRAIDEGTKADRAQLVVGGEVRGKLDFSAIGQGLSAFPFMLLLEQSKNERMLHDYLQSHNREVFWGTTFQGLTHDESSATVQASDKGGAVRTLKAQYLVGCDGAKSAVRDSLGLGFEGSTFERMFFVADVQLEWSFTHDSVYICLGRDNVLIFFPLKGEDRYRIVGSFPEDSHKDEREVSYDEIMAQIKTESHLDFQIHDVNWFSTYKVHTRHVERFSEGRCFVAGDAAHIHSPAGAQGMNTGIQDAYNLAWKLALVLKGKSTERLLDSYNVERLANARHLLRTTDRLFECGAGSEWWLAFVRTEILPAIAGTIMNIDAVKNFVFPLISQIGIEYRNSELSLHADDRHFHVKDGDRMPYFNVDGKSIYDTLRHPCFHLLTFSGSSLDEQYIKAQIDSKYRDLVDVTAFALGPEVTNRFGTDQPFIVLLRPDNYIGCLSPELSARPINSYLSTIMD